MPQRTIFTGFAPNLTRCDVITASQFLLFPWLWPSWRKGSGPRRVEAWLSNYLSRPHAVVFDSGRSALFFSLKSLGISLGDEVLLPAYTCMVVVNAIRHAGGIPLYVDVDEQGRMDPLDARKKITEKTRVMIIQHTFGIPADIDALLALAQEHRIQTIEDCAHVLGGTYKGQKLGTFGDIAIFSFGTDKAISCARGGAASTSREDIAKRLAMFQSGLRPTPIRTVFQHLCHFPIFAFGKRWYHWGAGKLILWLARHLKITSSIIYSEEKKGGSVNWYPAQFPNALALIAMDQLRHVDEVNAHRQRVAALYYAHAARFSSVRLLPENKEFIPLRFLLLVPKPKELMFWAKKQGIILGDWYQTVVAPADIDLTKTGYDSGSCPRAEKLANQSVNLPTDRQIGDREVARILSMLASYDTRTRN